MQGQTKKNDSVDRRCEITQDAAWTALKRPDGPLLQPSTSRLAHAYRTLLYKSSSPKQFQIYHPERLF